MYPVPNGHALPFKPYIYPPPPVVPIIPPPSGKQDRSAYIHPDWSGEVKPPYHSISHPSTYSWNFPPRERQKKAPAITSPSVSDQSSLSLLPPSTTSSDTPWLSTSDWPSLSPKVADVAQNEVLPKKPSKTTTLDRYAATYQPAWLRNLPPAEHTLYLGVSSRFPKPAYSPAFLVDSRTLRWRPKLDDSLVSVLTLPPAEVDEGFPVQPLREDRALALPGYYVSHFTHLLSLHLLSLIDEAKKALLFTTDLERYEADGPAQYILTVPGVREDTPKLFIGDNVFIRALDTNLKRPIGYRVEAEITGILKREGQVFLRSSSLTELVDYVENRGISIIYQAAFKASAVPVCAMQDAVRWMHTAMKDKESLARRWLFPCPGDCRVSQQSPRSLETPSVDPSTNGNSRFVNGDDRIAQADSRFFDPSSIDATLNEEQSAAIQAITSRDHTIPYLISGPPGTGKTRTLVAAILAILHVNPHAHILACAPSNPAADTITSRLVPHLAAKQLFRLNPPNRTFAEVPDDVLRYCHIENDNFGLPPYHELMTFRVVVTHCLDAAILVDARATNVDTMGTEQVCLPVFHPHQPRVLPHWTHLLVDEAGQASEPEMAIPLSVVLPPPVQHAGPEPVVVLCGDIHQLGPSISSEDARQGELDVSLLERLFDREVYASHQMSRTSIQRSSVHVNGHSDPPSFANLVRNYRSLPEILMIPSTLFYEDTLVPAAKDVTRLPWKRAPNPEMPVAFLGCDYEENWIEEGASWYNTGEIKLVVETCQDLMRDVQGLKQSQIAVITPWREQVWRVREALRKAKLGGVDVGNVETYQGREFRITIISTVRSSKRFVETDHKANMGFIFERKRFNVAITRAKELLVVIGNANCLAVDPHWNQFLQFCLRNKLYRGPKLKIEDKGACMSRLEIEMRMKKTVDEDEEQNLTIASAVAHIALDGH